MKNALVIYNGISKKSYFLTNLHVLIDDLIKQDYIVEIYATQKANDFIDKLKMTDNLDLLVCAGGDGTINEAVSAISMLKLNSSILYFPTGTVNDFAYSLGITKSYKKTINLLKSNSLSKIDTGLINNEIYFNYVAAIGHFTSASYDTNQKYKNLFGPNAYIINGISNLKNEEKFFRLAIEIDKDEYISGEFKYCLIVNSKSVAGIRNLFPNNNLDDGKFFLLLVQKNHGLSAVELPNIILNGIKDPASLNPKLGYVREFSTLNIKMDRPVTWSVDGEEGPVGDIKIEVLNKNIEIYSKLGDK